MTTREGAQKLVLISILGLVLISAYRGRLTSSQGGEGMFKRLWGVGWLSVFLGVMADVAPTLAGPFAVLILLGSMTSGGDQAIQNLLGNLGGGRGGGGGGLGPNPGYHGPPQPAGPHGATGGPTAPKPKKGGKTK